MNCTPPQPSTLAAKPQSTRNLIITLVLAGLALAVWWNYSDRGASDGAFAGFTTTSDDENGIEPAPSNQLRRAHPTGRAPWP